MKQDEDSRFSKVVSVTAFCGFGLLVALTLPLWLRTAEGWLEPIRVWLSARIQTPVPRPSAQPIPETPASVSWSHAEIEAALSECIKSVAPLTADLVAVAPLRNGECGTPVPGLLRSIGSKNRVTLDPPLLLNCPMVVSLYRWLDDVVQPAAQKAFGAPVSKLIGSSYSCRTVYNLPNEHLSQHAFANALDLPMFILADGRKVDFAHGWGPTQRELSGAANTKKTSSAALKGTSGQQKVGSGNSIAMTDVVRISAAGAPSKGDKQALDPATAAEAKFLRLVQQGACGIFSTVLGPEANDVHRTHLHLDLQDRKSLNVCR